MKSVLKLPIGIENFEEMRTEGFYYVDKTGLIIELLNNWGKVNLFTRPRRFGKTLNMNMLKYFFSYGCDQALFEGLEISREKELCEKYMGSFLRKRLLSTGSLSHWIQAAAENSLCLQIYLKKACVLYPNSSINITDRK